MICGSGGGQTRALREVFGPCPQIFHPCPHTVSWLGRVAPLGRNSPLPILGQRHPRALHCLRASQLPKLGSALPGDSPSMPTWRVGAPGPFPRVSPCPVHCPRGIRRLGPRISGSPVPTTYPGPPWALGLPRPTSPVPGVPTQRYAPFVATLPTHQQGSCTPPNRDRAYTPTNNKTTSILLI